MKIRPVEAELLHVDRCTDGETDMTKLIVAFRSFVNARNDIAEMVMPSLMNTLEW
jgi:hypothetical protein